MSLTQLEAELRAIENLYFTSAYAADSARAAIATIENSGGDLRTTLPRRPAKVAFNVPTGFEIRKFLKKEYLSQIRAVLFVRLVSALEVYLVDQVRHVFMTNKSLFARTEVVEIQLHELLATSTISQLWATFIQKECRRLQNQGFSEVRKYYRNTLKLDFGSADVSLPELEEMHDRRHLLVHRLGKTDRQYRHRYNSSAPHVDVTEEYLLRALENVRSLAKWIQVGSKGLADPSMPPQQPRAYRVRLDVVDVTKDGLIALQPEFMVPKSGSLKQVLESRIGGVPECTLLLSGDHKPIILYIKELRRRQKAGQLLIQERAILSKGHACRLPDEEVQRIATMLPSGRLPKHVHKTIADELNLSRKQVSAAIAVILEHPEMFRRRPAALAGEDAD